MRLGLFLVGHCLDPTKARSTFQTSLRSPHLLTMVPQVHHPPLRRSEPMVTASALNINVSSADHRDGRICVTYDVCSDALEEGKVFKEAAGYTHIGPHTCLCHGLLVIQLQWPCTPLVPLLMGVKIATLVFEW